MGFSYGGCCGSLPGKGLGGGSIYQTFIKREKVGGRAGDEVSGAFRLSGICAFFVLCFMPRPVTSWVYLGSCGMCVGVCKARSALLEKSVP